jgi:hypothetical protein
MLKLVNNFIQQNLHVKTLNNFIQQIYQNVSPNPTLLGSIKQLKLKQRDKDENSRKSESGLV